MAILLSDSNDALPSLSLIKQFAEAATVSPADLDAEAAAALRQFSQERLMSYGVDYADAKELRTRVEQGEKWRDVAQDLAATCLAPPEARVAPETPFTRSVRLYRASALQRMSQMMFQDDDEARRAIVREAVRLYGLASDISGDRRSVAIETDEGVLAGWLHPAVGTPVGSAIVIGGVEGWAMDFGSLGVALAQRGVHAMLLDGPGQGQTRLANRYYLSAQWAHGYSRAVDFLEKEFPALPVGFVGNSMGGSVATLFAAQDGRIAACVNNGGPMYAARRAANTSFFRKMMAHCGDVTVDHAFEMWTQFEPLSSPDVIQCPYLVIHGATDPLVTNEEAALNFERAASADKSMLTWSDGIHCVYNHEQDKQDVISDWLADRLDRS